MPRSQSSSHKRQVTLAGEPQDLALLGTPLLTEIGTKGI